MDSDMDLVPFHYEVVSFPLSPDLVTNVIGGAAVTINKTLSGRHLGAFNAVEAAIILDSIAGAGANPTLDVKLQSSMDNFATAGLIKDIITFTQLTAAGSELKVARRTYSGTPIFFGAIYHRLHIVADGDGASLFTGRVILNYFRD